MKSVTRVGFFYACGKQHAASTPVECGGGALCRPPDRLCMTAPDPDASVHQGEPLVPCHTPQTPTF